MYDVNKKSNQIYKWTLNIPLLFILKWNWYAYFYKTKSILTRNIKAGVCPILIKVIIIAVINACESETNINLTFVILILRNNNHFDICTPSKDMS